MYPCIKIEFSPVIPDSVEDPEKYNWVIFPSQHAVKAFCHSVLRNDRAQRDQLTVRNLEINQPPLDSRLNADSNKLESNRIWNDIQFAVIGEQTKTQFIKLFKKAPDFMPSAPTAKNLGQELPVKLGQTILLPQSNLARPELKTILQSRGCQVTSFTAYKNILDDSENKINLELEKLDYIYFASPSAINNFLFKSDNFTNSTALCIGPTTLKAAKKHFERYEVSCPEINS